MTAGPSGTRIGSEIAGFRIESVLGRGGMSVVYLAEQVRLGRKVALKVLVHQIIELDDTFRDRFLQESHLAAQLDHPNVIPIYDAGEADGCLYIAMRYVEGRDVGQMLEQQGPLSVGRTIYILEQVASALDAAHERGLVHRDVKPANILLVEQSDRIYLTDFGVAKPTTSAGLTRTGFFIGTPDYSAPEQIEGRPVDARTDVYALGAVLYACLTATAPYARDTEVAVLQAHLLEPPPKLSDARPDLPRGLDRVIAQAMAKASDDRYATCGELINAARAASLDRPPSLSDREMAAIATPGGRGTPVEPPPSAAARPPEMPPPPAAGGAPSGKRPRWRGTRLLVGILVLAVLALAATLAAVLATRGGNSSATASESSGTSFSVAMTGSAEVPKSISNAASGTAKVTVNGTDVCWDFKLNGVDEPNAAHIHRGGPSVSGPVVVPLGGKFSRKGCTTATKAAAREILADPGNHYVNVHSVTFPDGVVRGQLSTAAAPPYEAAPATKEATGLRSIVPSPVFKNCTVQTNPRAGAVQTAVCVPPAGATTFYPKELELSIFRNARAAAAAYTSERTAADVGTNFGRCDGTSWAGEGTWFHAPAAPGQPGKQGGRRFCYFDGNVAVIVWTHGKFGQASHVDLLGIAREGGSDHASLFSWWRFWHHRIGKCLEVGCVAKP